MTKETHSSGGILLALIGLQYFLNTYLNDYNILYTIVLVGVYFYSSYIGSLLPDIDMRSSYISKRHPLLSKHFGRKCRHRGFTHSLLFLFILSKGCELLVLIGQHNIVFISVSTGFLLGYLSHLVLDILTKEGIELFFPCRINFKLLPIKTNSKPERYINSILNFLVMILILYNFYIILNLNVVYKLF